MQQKFKKNDKVVLVKGSSPEVVMTITAVSGGHEFVYQTDGSKKWISEDKLKRYVPKTTLTN